MESAPIMCGLGMSGTSTRSTRPPVSIKKPGGRVALSARCEGRIETTNDKETENGKCTYYVWSRYGGGASTAGFATNAQPSAQREAALLDHRGVHEHNGDLL